MCTLCDSTNINTIMEFVPHVSGDGFNGGSDSYLQFRDTHAPCLLKLCVPPSNGIVRWWLCSLIWCGIAAGQLYPDNDFELLCIMQGETKKSLQHTEGNTKFH